LLLLNFEESLIEILFLFWQIIKNKEINFDYIDQTIKLIFTISEQVKYEFPGDLVKLYNIKEIASVLKELADSSIYQHQSLF
jgi:hypothetical protein